VFELRLDLIPPVFQGVSGSGCVNKTLREAATLKWNNQRVCGAIFHQRRERHGFWQSVRTSSVLAPP
jgi:hypothetical protein